MMACKFTSFHSFCWNEYAPASSVLDHGNGISYDYNKHSDVVMKICPICTHNAWLQRTPTMCDEKEHVHIHPAQSDRCFLFRGARLYLVHQLMHLLGCEFVHQLVRTGGRLAARGLIDMYLTMCNVS